MIVLGYVLLFSENCTDSMRPLRLLGRVCSMWRAVISVMPLPHLVVTNTPQAQRLLKAFEIEALAARHVKSLAFESYADIEPKLGSPSVIPAPQRYHLKFTFTAMWGMLLERCPNTVRLSLMVEMGRNVLLYKPEAVFAADFLTSPGLARLASLSITFPDINAHGSFADVVLPLLSACSSLSSLIIHGRLHEAEELGAFQPSYNLENLEILDIRCRCDGTCDTVSAILGQATSLKRLVVSGSRISVVSVPFTIDHVQLGASTMESIETVTYPLPSSLQGPLSFPRLKTCLLGDHFHAGIDDFRAIATSAVEVIRIANRVATCNTCMYHAFIPMLRKGGFPSVTTIAVEYIYEQHYYTLNRLEVIEDACIKKGIEFELVPEI